MTAVAIDVEHLVARWQEEVARGPRSGRVDLLVRRLGTGDRDTPPRAELDVERGLIGDRWEWMPNRPADGQISIMDRRVVDALVPGDRSRWSVPGDNLIVDLDLSEAALPVGTRLRVGSAELEVTAKVHAGCAKFRSRLGADALAWVNGGDRGPLRLRGVFARVVIAGAVAVGDVVETIRSLP